MPNEEADLIRKLIIVKGVVQGVGFRYFTRRLARQMGLKGYVRNLSSGNVEVDVEGEEGMVNELVKKLRIGPPSSHVTGIEVEDLHPEGEYSDFGVKF